MQKLKQKIINSLTHDKQGKLCPNGKCLATKHDQTLFGDQAWWCCTEWPNGIKHVWSPSKRTKCFTMFDQMFVVVQILSNTIKQSVQTGKCLVTKQCLIVFDRQTFPVWTGLNSAQVAVIFRGKPVLSSPQTSNFGFRTSVHNRWKLTK